MMSYNILDKLFLRTPFYSYKNYSLYNAVSMLQDQFFQTALFLASPQFYRKLEAKRFEALTSKEQLTVAKYYNRMCFRPTPFGSFSSFTVAQWGNDPFVRLETENSAKLHVNIDQEVALSLANVLLDRDVRTISFMVNHSLYTVGKEYRFIKTHYTEGFKRIFFDLESYEYNVVLKGLIAFCKASLRKGSEVIDFIIQGSGYEQETAVEYLTFLVSAQILIAHEANNVIGEDYLSRLMTDIASPESSFQDALRRIYQQMKMVSLPAIRELDHLSNHLNDLMPAHQQQVPTQYFYTGLERTVSDGSLPERFQQQIKEGLYALSVLSQPAQPGSLQQFIDDFKLKYDRQKVPLLAAIDPESGIGYGNYSPELADADLLREVKFQYPKATRTKLEWSKVHQLLLRRWIENSNSTAPIVLTATELAEIPVDQNLVSPPTLAVLFRTLGDDLLLESAGGITATALVGRFTSWSEDVLKLSKQLAGLEQAANPDVLFADIGQVSDTHADNINRRKHSYDYEITVNSVSTLPENFQIPLSDLWISVVDDKLVLESASLKQVIVPRLSSAYNYSRNHLAAFRFLCDLQHQGLKGSYAFQMEQYFPGMAQYPRVVYHQTILSLASWHLSAKELQHIFLKPGNALTAFKLLVQKIRLAPVVALNIFDQQLVFDLANDQEIEFLLSCIKGLDQVKLQEYIVPSDTKVYRNDDSALIAQGVAFLYKNEAVYHASPETRVTPVKPAVREFIIGTQWLYLKLYCNPVAANELLSKKLLPLLKRMSPDELKSWFFVRYKDSGYHIRLRLNVSENAIGSILRRIRKRLSGVLNYHVIREYQADTYRRELERYGSDMIATVEGFFHGSSELVLNFIKETGRRRFRNTYHSLAFVSVNDMLHLFFPDEQDRQSLVRQMADTFFAEFAGDKSLRVNLDQKYRELTPEIKTLLSATDFYDRLRLRPQADLFVSQINLVIKKASVFSADRKKQLLADMIHMHLNRLFIDRQRKQELVIYYCLHKYSMSLQAIRKKSN
jgi:thiopeptide-type bacteriocin biosynthesis protein